MNEKIKELIAQATTEEHGVIQPRQISTVYHFDKEKFAELIVRECAERCFNIALKHREVETPRASGKKAGALECSEDLLAHFGVDP